VKIGLTYTARASVANIACGIVDLLPRANGSIPRSLYSRDDDEEEFDSPETIAAIAEALTGLGHDVELLGDGLSLAHRLLTGELPEFVFNIAEGRGISRSREAWAPALLEMFGIPYTGSDPLTLAATLDKNCAKRLVREAGVAVPAGVLVDRPPEELASELAALPLPVIVKPAFEGSSKGINGKSVVDDCAMLHDVVAQCVADYRQPVLVEQFIEGDELTVGIVGNVVPEVMGIMRVVPIASQRRFVYGLDVKRDWRRQVRYEVPAQLSRSDEETIRKSALMAFGALGCRDVARLDFRLRHGVPYFLEANPLPGLAPGSGDLVLLAEGVGIGYRELIGRILNAAVARASATSSVRSGIPSTSSSLASGVFAAG
jgi:D-alanine-D-alanine ligase